MFSGGNNATVCVVERHSDEIRDIIASRYCLEAIASLIFGRLVSI